MEYPVSELYLLQCSATIDLRMVHHSLSHRFLLNRNRYEFPFRPYSWSEQGSMSIQQRAEGKLSRRGPL